jgi:hypothetical protein
MRSVIQKIRHEHPKHSERSLSSKPSERARNLPIANSVTLPSAGQLSKSLLPVRRYVSLSRPPTDSCVNVVLLVELRSNRFPKKLVQFQAFMR